MRWHMERCSTGVLFDRFADVLVFVARRNGNGNFQYGPKRIEAYSAAINVRIQVVCLVWINNGAYVIKVFDFII